MGISIKVGRVLWRNEETTQMHDGALWWKIYTLSVKEKKKRTHKNWHPFPSH